MMDPAHDLRNRIAEALWAAERGDPTKVPSAFDPTDPGASRFLQLADAAIAVLPELAEVARLTLALSEARQRVAAVVQSHDAPGGCRGPVGYTAMGQLAEWLEREEDANG